MGAAAVQQVDVPLNVIPGDNGLLPFNPDNSFGGGLLPDASIEGTVRGRVVPEVTARRGFLGIGRREAVPAGIEVLGENGAARVNIAPEHMGSVVPVVPEPAAPRRSWFSRNTPAAAAAAPEAVVETIAQEAPVAAAPRRSWFSRTPAAQPQHVEIPRNLIQDANGLLPFAAENSFGGGVLPDASIQGSVRGRIIPEVPARRGFLGIGRREAIPGGIEITGAEGATRVNIAPEHMGSVVHVDAPAPAPRRGWFSRPAPAPVEVNVPAHLIPDANGMFPASNAADFGAGILPDANVQGTVRAQLTPEVTARRGFFGIGRREGVPESLVIPGAEGAAHTPLNLTSEQRALVTPIVPEPVAAAPRRSWNPFARPAPGAEPAVAQNVANVERNVVNNTERAVVNATERAAPRVVNNVERAVVNNTERTIVNAVEHSAPTVVNTLEHAAVPVMSAAAAGHIVGGMMPGSPGIVPASVTAAMHSGPGRSGVSLASRAGEAISDGMYNAGSKVSKWIGGSRAGMRNAMNKYVIGAGAVAAGAYIFSALRESKNNEETNKIMDREIQALKGNDPMPLMTAASMTPPMPQLLPQQQPVAAPQQFAPTPEEQLPQPEVLPAQSNILAAPEFQMPKPSEPLSAAAPAGEVEDTTFRDMVKAQRGGEVGKPQPFVAPKSSLAEAVMNSKDLAAAPTLSA